MIYLFHINLKCQQTQLGFFCTHFHFFVWSCIMPKKNFGFCLELSYGDATNVKLVNMWSVCDKKDSKFVSQCVTQTIIDIQFYLSVFSVPFIHVYVILFYLIILQNMAQAWRLIRFNTYFSNVLFKQLDTLLHSCYVLYVIIMTFN